LPSQFHGGNFRAWLHQIARSVIIDHARKRRPELVDEYTHVADPRTLPVEQPLIEAEHGEALRRCLEQLAPEAADLVRARLGGEEYEHCCARLGISANRAYKMMNEAKARLKACVERALS
jgi:RNA polymerase sigma factor (sigma-70 family)